MSWLLWHSAEWVLNILSPASCPARPIWLASSWVGTAGRHPDVVLGCLQWQLDMPIVSLDTCPYARPVVLSYLSEPGVDPFSFDCTPLAPIYVDGYPYAYATYGSPTRFSMAALATTAKSDTACHCSCCIPGGPLPRLRARWRPWPNLGSRDGIQIWNDSMLPLGNRELVGCRWGFKEASNKQYANQTSHGTYWNDAYFHTQWMPGNGKNCPSIS